MRRRRSRHSEQRLLLPSAILAPQRHDPLARCAWYQLAADQGHAYAQYFLGSMYNSGRGVPQDDAEAVRWYRLAAEQGLALAQYSLGVRYASGQGVPQDHAEAVRWFRLALEDCPVFVYIYGLPVELWAQAS